MPAPEHPVGPREIGQRRSIRLLVEMEFWPIGWPAATGSPRSTQHLEDAAVLGQNEAWSHPACASSGWGPDPGSPASRSAGRSPRNGPAGWRGRSPRSPRLSRVSVPEPPSSVVTEDAPPSPPPWCRACPGCLSFGEETMPGGRAEGLHRRQGVIHPVPVVQVVHHRRRQEVQRPCRREWRSTTTSAKRQGGAS